MRDSGIVSEQPGTNLFKNSTEYRELNAGETLFSAGETGTEMFVVREGRVNILINGQVVESVGPTGIFGEMSLVSEDHIRSATAVAETDAQVVPVDRRRFMVLCERSPFFAIEVMRVMAHRIRTQSELLYPKA